MNTDNKTTAIDTIDPKELRYAIKIGDTWLPEMIGTTAADGSDITYAGIIGSSFRYFTLGGVEKYRVFSEKSKWSKWFTKFDKDNPAGDGSPILAIEIFDKAVMIGIHVKGGYWLPQKMGTYDGDTDKPTYAGCMVPIDGIWIDR